MINVDRSAPCYSTSPLSLSLSRSHTLVLLPSSLSPSLFRSRSPAIGLPVPLLPAGIARPRIPGRWLRISHVRPSSEMSIWRKWSKGSIAYVFIARGWAIRFFVLNDTVQCGITCYDIATYSIASGILHCDIYYGLSICISALATVNAEPARRTHSLSRTRAISPLSSAFTREFIKRETEEGRLLKPSNS